MNDNNILEFLDAYKNLDKLCRQILSSDRGVSEYIDEMNNESQGYRIAGWDRDYKQLKRMRWIRNRLVHETDSFEDNLFNTEDIEWLHTFYSRIMECEDPFSLLHQAKNTKVKTGKQEKSPEIYFQTHRASTSQNENLQNRNIILAGMLLTGIILTGIAICFLFYEIL